MYDGLGTEDAPNLTYTMVWGQRTHQTLRIQWFGTGDAPNVTHTLVWGQTMHHTIRIQWFGDTGRTKRYVYNGVEGFPCHGEPGEAQEK